LVIHAGRSGSTVVGDMLDQHPEVSWDGEVYQPIFQKRQYSDQSLPPITDIDAVRYAVDQSRSVIARHYGFEVKFFHLRVLGADLAPWLDAIEAQMPNLRYVVLRRRNLLRAIVSVVAARASGTWHVDPYDRTRRVRVRIDPDAVFVNRTWGRLIEVLREFERDFAALDGLLAARPSLPLSYEEDVMDDPSIAYAKVCAHLGLQAGTPTVRYARTNPHPLCELMDNHAEVAAALRGSEFEWMLEA
jgi:LPS sulfotransferase NodH